MRDLPNNKATELKNVTCVYCGNTDNPENPLTREHVVGRRFVPKGSFANGWSLIVQACKSCNNIKSDLEDDISAITLQPDIGKQHDDPLMVELSRRKAQKSISRSSGKQVAESSETLKLNAEMMPGVNFAFSLIAPAQLDSLRTRRLAYMHLQAFFYLITYDKKSGKGGFMPGIHAWVIESRRSDWGNRVLRSFAELTKSWTPRVIGTGAEGYFRIAIRRDPSGAEVWSFALEWNQSFRIAGFFGDPQTVPVYVKALPNMDMHRIGPELRFREEIALPPNEDTLFDPGVPVSKS